MSPEWLQIALEDNKNWTVFSLWLFGALVVLSKIRLIQIKKRKFRETDMVGEKQTMQDGWTFLYTHSIAIFLYILVTFGLGN